MRLYLAGPMTGIPEFNFPEFNAARAALAGRGHEVFSPATNGRAVFGLNTTGMTGDPSELAKTRFNRRSALAMDLNYICRRADAVIVLSGWANSTGARAEVAAAEALGLPVWRYHQFLEHEDNARPVGDDDLTSWDCHPEPDRELEHEETRKTS